MGNSLTDRAAELRAERSDPEAVRRLTEKLLPEVDSWQALLPILASGIERAHRANPASWSLTLGGAGDRLVFNVGRGLAFRLMANEVLIIADSRKFEEARKAEPALESVENHPYQAVPGTGWLGFEPQTLVKHWPHLEDAYLAGVESATRVKRTPYFSSHSPGVLVFLEEVLGRPLPRPEHGEDAGRVTPAIARGLVDRLRRSFPQWNGFAHQEFVDDEVTYKQEAAAQAQEILARDELRQLLAQEEFDEVLQRLKKVAHSLNLLYMGTPSSGDLAVLHDESLDERAFCEAIFDLLHGEEESPARLDRFVRHLERHDLPNKWTFPTYYLFLLDPENEFFVKPGVTRSFLDLLDLRDLYSPQPSGEAYRTILQLISELAEALAEYQPRDMIDMQSLLFVADSEPPATKMDPPLPRNLHPALPLHEIARETSLDQGLLERWVRAIERKKQAVLYGPPGTGKTHVARLLARHLVAGGDGLVELVQFHPSTSYEDFIQGIRPTPDEKGRLAYPLREGRFLDFCRRAREREGLSILIIDEINRAELSRVFGELMYLLEYRDEEIPLAAGGDLFGIPESIRLIGTMNTADRSIALVDHALRRRFAFLRLDPQHDVLRAAHRDTGFRVDALIEVLDEINREIADPHYALGITFFLDPDLDTLIEDVWHMEIEPYLEEFFFDRPQKIDAFRWPRVRERLK